MEETNHPDVTNKLATCPFNARYQVPWLKSVIISPAVTIKVVLSRMLSTKPGTLDKRHWLRAHGRALLAVKTGIKICGNRPAPHLSGADYCGNNSSASEVVMEHKSALASRMCVPSCSAWKNNRNAQKIDYDFQTDKYLFSLPPLSLHLFDARKNPHNQNYFK
ncbi:hypothetical protein HPG69_005382 [Diceros bicornis minor]|uniref:Uncharacterized protein n=1 Tax=Diceros bicornis minor TaxID=77932 RepID=A0A7J7ELK9_DICBM|nr:hypothetical protein HPG69_005382 [Diceros bicornis minor]